MKPLKNLLSLSPERLKNIDRQDYHETLATLFSFVGDVNRAAIEFKKSGSLNEDGWAKYLLKDTNSFTITNFYAVLKNIALNNRVIMFNEAHHIPISRTFVASLLPHLKQYGYQYLALEALNSDFNASDKAYMLGNYTKEPQMFNLIMYAKQLGFTIIKYEPDYFSYKHTADARDSLQAENLYKVLKKDPNTKIVVLAGYGHIQERIPNHTMASILQEISSINPLTINLIAFNQYTNASDTKKLYNSIAGTLKVEIPSILLRKNNFDFYQNKTYDYNVIFPFYKETYLRPNWIRLNTDYHVLKCNAIAPFQLVQAYKENSARSLEEITQFNVPTDQKCLMFEDKQTDLYLIPGNYLIVYRDANYGIIKSSKKHIK
ncbi:hypothetical protein [Mucilaginibacter sp. UYCu711]|uniref:hypothetical protein n=1 Tax=Mucilaginibacter sp. UYCu711 TaxID=3156339 RepID=UPI003D232C85